MQKDISMDTAVNWNTAGTMSLYRTYPIKCYISESKAFGNWVGQNLKVITGQFMISG